MRKIFITLCKNSTDKYHLNILKIIALIYHIYTEYEFYNLAYNNNPFSFYEHQLITATMGKWDDQYTQKYYLETKSFDYM